MTRQKRASYSPEFKREAVRLLAQGDKEASQLARELGVARNKLYRWKEEIDHYGGSAFPSKGECHDNAVAESFFHTLKVEQVYHEDYKTRSQARSALFDYIEVFYNRQRKHSHLNYQSPVEFEGKHLTNPTLFRLHDPVYSDFFFRRDDDGSTQQRRMARTDRRAADQRKFIQFNRDGKSLWLESVRLFKAGVYRIT